MSDIRYNFMARFDSKIHQTTAYTAIDRYPAAFSQTQSLLADGIDVRILSFGCSTGEEVVSLRKYFPQAHIIGAELNKSRLKKCRKMETDERISFVRSTDENIRKSGPYNAIFAMAVLQRKPHEILHNGTVDLSQIYAFSAFNSQLNTLDANLLPGGFMIIQHTQYRFRDCDIFHRYESCYQIKSDKLLPSFDRNGLLISGAPYNEIIFRKIN